MKSVFEASTALEAHMVLNLLQQLGVDGRVEGEHLQGGIGELQALGIVRVVVPDGVFSEAKKIVCEWEKNQPDDPIQEKVKIHSSSGILKFIIGLVLGVSGMYWVYNSPVTSGGIDYNWDGVLDEKWTFTNNRIVKSEVDRNLDGKIDFIHYYSTRGIIERAESDDNFDGIFETKYKYHLGNPSIQESDLNNDGEIDYWMFFEYGVLKEAKISGNSFLSPKKRQQYKMNKLVSADFDADGDGIYEKKYEYDYFEQQKK